MSATQSKKLPKEAMEFAKKMVRRVCSRVCVYVCVHCLGFGALVDIIMRLHFAFLHRF